MKLIIAGSRTFTDYQLLCQHAGARAAPASPRSSLAAPGARISSATAGRGSMQVKHQLFRADWERFGKSAGVRRNYQMAQAGDMLLAFWDGRSAGTQHMISCMQQLGKPVVVIRTDDQA